MRRLKDELEGVWRLVSMTMAGRDVGSSESHRVFRGPDSWTISGIGQILHDDQPRTTESWELDESAPIPVLALRSVETAPDGATLRSTTERALLALAHDQLRLAWQRYDGVMPTRIADEPGRLERFERETDPELIERYRQPPGSVPRPTLRDPRFGKMRWEGSCGWWEADVDIGGNSVLVQITASEQPDAAVMDRGWRIVERLRGGKLADIYQAAAAHFLGLYNDTWREERPRLASAEFIARLTPSSLGIDESGAVDLFLDDGDLFYGHAIALEMDGELILTGEPYLAG